MPKKRKQPTTFDEFLGAEIESRFSKRGMSQDAAAAALGWSLSSYGRKMRGETPITAPELVRVAGYLQKGAADIVDQALADFGGIDKLMSEASTTTEDASKVTQLVRPDTANDLDNYRRNKTKKSAADQFNSEAEAPENDE